MSPSLADQTVAQLGGPHSVLTRQKRDHIELDRLIESIDAATGDERGALLNRLCRLVFPHAFAEESVLWPAIRRWVPEGEELTLEIEREHQEINELFTELEKLDVDSPQHHELWRRIVALLREDVRDEEDRLLPMLQQAVPHRALVALGWAWEATRRTSPTRPHPVVARRPPGNVAAAAPLTFVDRGRDRLDQLSRRSGGTLSSASTSLSGALARVAGVIEHLPPLTRGEDPSTYSGRTP
ncbi:Hemerythrin HHE cation binding domain-containing protein [Mycolicibacterium rutilum]|uniref:Hemerythrin HHE cation binding domain-containing protein n=1 Tax=Mycolicibacterium rutilum TaxID=370526 RepID=A0A1H6M6B9_MYCRU|nr:hemerythrin domain-containing protein [Mycolicibacterium rutilum]SEH93013.1 Hemerythrin HHE cation binding domain-containing protein [Mycolicibacterium rutilum]